MKLKFFLIAGIAFVGSVFFMACNGSSDKKSNDQNEKQNSEVKFYSDITKSNKGDFRGFSLGESTPDNIKASEDANALSNDTPEELTFQYQLDDYNRYDVKYLFDNGTLKQIHIDYYSYENDGNQAYNNGKNLYDALMKDLTDKYGEPKKFAEQNYTWDVKSNNGADMHIRLMNTGQEGNSGTVQISFYL